MALVAARGTRRDIAARASVSPDFAALARELKGKQRQLGNTVDCWEDLAPVGLRSCVRVESFVGGVLHLIVADSSTAFVLDRALRSGLETALRQATAGKLLRVRTRIGAV